MRKHILLLFFVSLLFNTLYAKDINIDNAVVQSIKEKKKVLIYLHRIGCSYCNSMQEFTLEDKEVERYISENYILISINISLEDDVIYIGKRSSALDFAKSIRYNFYPSSVFMDSNSKIIDGYPGYKNEIEYMTLLHYMNSNLYSTMNFELYKKKIGFAYDDTNLIKDTRKHER